MSILDEIDSGLDIDALRDVSAAVNGLKRDDGAVLMVTHYKVGWVFWGGVAILTWWWRRRLLWWLRATSATLFDSQCHKPSTGSRRRLIHPPANPSARAQRLLDYIKPQYVHIMEAGRITQTGGMDLVDQLEAGGYAMLSTAA
jgi:hypothetical protein